MGLFQRWRQKRILQKLESDKDFAKQFLSLLRKSHPAGELVAAGSYGGVQPFQFDTTSHLKVYLVNVYCFAAMRAIAKDVAATPVLIQQRKRIEGKYQWETQDESNPKAVEIMNFFARPNTDETWGQLTTRWELSHIGTGNGYLAFDKKDSEFWYLRPDWVHVKTDAIGRPIGYSVENLGKVINLEFTDVIHLKSANPTGEWYGMPASEVIKQTIIGKLNLDTFLNATWKHGAMLGLVISGNQLDLKDEDARAIIKKELNALYGGADKAGKTAVFGGDTKVDRISYPIKDLIPTEINDMVMREVCAAYGVPPIKINILDEATYNNAKEQERIYQEGTIEPERCLIEDTINLQFIYPRYGDEFRFYYDRSKVLALQENRGEKSVYVVREYDSGILTLNEAREQLGHEKIDELDGGDDFKNPSLPEEVGSAASDGSDKTLNRPSVINRKDASIPRLQKWKALDRRLRGRERKLQSKVSKFFREQLGRLLEKVDLVTGSGKMMWRLEFFTKAGEIPEGWINDLFNIDEENVYIAKALEDVLADIAKDAGQAALEAAGVDMQFNVKDPRVQIAIANMQNKIKGINQTTWNEVRVLITESYQAGETIAEMSGKLSDKFGDFSITRSRTIARTETNKFSNASSMEGLRQAGIEKKEWLSSRDDRVRPEHAEADGQIRNLNEPFDVGGEELMFPGDPVDDGSQTINCRCQIVSAET